MATSWPFQNQNPHDVVTDDRNDPDTSWAAHVGRSGRGGVDHVCEEGTPVYANAAGVVHRIPLSDGGSAGRQVRVRAATGWDDWYVHLRAFATGAPEGSTVRQGQLIGYSGGSGYGKDLYYIPHLHLHRTDPNGDRQNPWHYFGGDGVEDTRDNKPGKIESTLETGEPNITFYRRYEWLLRARSNYTYAIDGKFLSIPFWRAKEGFLRAYGYTGASDGHDSLDLRKAEQRFARQGGYLGPVDGDPGENTYRALSKILNTL